MNPVAPPFNLLTIDFEDWYQLSGELLGAQAVPHPVELERQTDRLLGLLAKHHCRATFFCLGRSLEHAPHLVRRVADAGHELGTHGWTHGRVYQVGLAAYREDLRRAIGWQSDLTGRAVLGHRAAAFSVAPAQLEGFYDLCFELGLRYDSSVFPFRGRRYGIPGAPREPHVVRRDGERTLTEFPLATVEWCGRRFAVGGGGWWRLLPRRMIEAALTTLNQAGLPATTYFHQYEFDVPPLSASRVAGSSLRSWKWTLRQNLGRAAIYRKLDRMLARFRFGAVEDYLRAAGSL